MSYLAGVGAPSVRANPVQAQATQAVSRPPVTTSAVPVDAFGPARSGQTATVGDPVRVGPPDGRAFVQKAVEEIRARVANGEACRVVFDIDDTLADSRGRTLHILQQYDLEKGTSHFGGLELSEVAADGYLTAKHLGLPKAVVTDVQKFWRAKFFDGPLNIHDLPMTEIVALAKAAKAAGAEVRYLTGRTEDIRGDTRSELQRFGLPDADDAHLFMKPDQRTKTGEYKAQVFREWSKDEVFTGFFITESRRDIAAVQGATPEIPCVLIDSAKERHGPAIDPSTPVYPSQTNLFGEPSPWEPSLGWTTQAA